MKVEVDFRYKFDSIWLVPETEEERLLLDRWQNMKAYPQLIVGEHPRKLHIIFLSKT